MGRTATIVLGLLLTLFVAAGCTNRTGSYCAQLRSDQHRLHQLAAQAGRDGKRGDVLTEALHVFTELQQRAPANIRPDYDLLVSAYSNLRDALTKAGVDPGSFRPGHRPAGLSSGEYQSIRQAALALDSDRVRHAAQRIEDHAQQVCHVDLRR